MLENIFSGEPPRKSCQITQKLLNEDDYEVGQSFRTNAVTSCPFDTVSSIEHVSDKNSTLSGLNACKGRLGYEFETDDLRHWPTMDHTDLERNLDQKNQMFCLIPEKQETAENLKSASLLKNGPQNERLDIQLLTNAEHSSATTDSLDKARILGTSSE